MDFPMSHLFLSSVGILNTPVIWWDCNRATIMEGDSSAAGNGCWMEGLTRGSLLLWLLVRNLE